MPNLDTFRSQILGFLQRSGISITNCSACDLTEEVLARIA